MDRRKFIGGVSVVAGASLMSWHDSTAAISNDMELIKPKKIVKGSTIGLITPGSALVGDAEERAVANLESLGLKVLKSSNFNERTGFIAGSDEDRIADIHEMFANPDVDAIICARGGYGTGRLLSGLDYDLIKSNPKPLVGFSDITALHYAIFKNTGMVCYHAPVASSKFSEFSIESLKTVLFQNKKQKMIRPIEWKEKDEEAFQYRSWNDGVAQGKLIGGNLSLMCSVLGTPYDVDFTDKIVFIEEVGESLYRVDRMLTQLLNSGKLNKCAGIALGVFYACKARSGGVDDDGYVSLSSVLGDRLGGLNVPVAYGLPFGHIDDHGVLPIGVQAKLDTKSKSLTLLEKAMS
ncbi:MAG: LD-carboxypeptidase [Reichenbachiella sp.]